MLKMFSRASLRSWRLLRSSQPSLRTTAWVSRGVLGNKRTHYRYFTTEQPLSSLEETEQEQEEQEQEVEIKEVDPEAILKLNLIRFERALELKEKGENFLLQEKYDLALNTFSSCIATFESHITFKHQDSEESEIEKERATVLFQPLIGLAYTQQCIGRLEEAIKSYQTIIRFTKLADHDKESIARVYMNYAELQSLEQDTLSAIDSIKTAISLIGKKNELHASAVSNLGVYYAILNRHDEALPFAKEGYETFCSALGKNNQYTEYALDTYTDVLRECKQEKEATKIRENWEIERRERELKIEGEEEFNVDALGMGDTLAHFSKKKAFDPPGFIVPPQILHAQQELFVKKTKEVGFAVGSDADLFTLEKENLTSFWEQTKKHHNDIKQEMVEDLEYQTERLSHKGVTAPTLTMATTEYHEEFPGNAR